jgi:hypothetical protein
MKQLLMERYTCSVAPMLIVQFLLVLSRLLALTFTLAPATNWPQAHASPSSSQGLGSTLGANNPRLASTIPGYPIGPMPPLSGRVPLHASLMGPGMHVRRTQQQESLQHITLDPAMQPSEMPPPTYTLRRRRPSPSGQELEDCSSKGRSAATSLHSASAQTGGYESKTTSPVQKEQQRFASRNVPPHVESSQGQYSYYNESTTQSMCFM